MNKAAVAKTVKHIEEYCQEHGIRFTEPRRHVVEIIAAAQKPIGAYDILAALGRYIENPKPPTAYRAIEFLIEHGFIHKIESLNAFMLCNTDHRHKGSQFMICDHCGKVIETHLCQLPDDLSKRAKAAGFNLSRWDAELHGTCSDCQR